MVEPEGFVMMNVQVPCVKGYNEDQIAIVMEDPGLKDFQVILGTAMIYRVMEVIKESGNFRAGHTMGLLQALLAYERCPCSNEPNGSE